MAVGALSGIEEHVVLLVANGRSHREIAEELGVSARTVEWHALRARHKLEQAAELHGRVAASTAGPDGAPGRDASATDEGESE